MKQTVLDKISGCLEQKIIIIGDIILDEYHWCKVERISPEAPVPICKVQKTTLVPGGAANVAHNIQTLQNKPVLFGVIGNDSSGEKLTQVFRDQNLETTFIIKDDTKPTILKSRIIANQQHVVRVDREDADAISRKTQTLLLKNLELELDDAQALLISDYQKGTLPDKFIKKIILLANKKKIKVIVDPKGDHYLKYKGAYLLTPNFHEFQTVVKKSVRTEKEILVEAQRLIKKLNLEALIITRSEKGMSIVTREGEKIDIPTKAKEVYDITGAGDTVISVLTIALAAKCNIEEAGFLANYAAGIVVGKIGTSTTTFPEIIASIEADLQ
ncbi:MAG: rfaE bifunctional protein kinase chain/domain [Candidatus Marinamargulisbacteria bacterium]|jgi:rfaE bifunctional protein kinase chain/domain